MRKTLYFRILLLIAYCIPYAYLAVWGDGVQRTMIFYGVMVVGLSLLCWGAIKTNDLPLLAAGNILSFTVSFAAARFTDLAPMGEYFKPFTSLTLIAAISLIAVGLQNLTFMIFTRKKAVK